MVFVALTLLLLMIGLLASFFGAAIYFAVFADFPRDAAAVILGVLLALKVVMAVCLVLAHQRFLQNTGLVILVILSLVLDIVIAFLHDLLPGFLTSITDAVAAIIVAIVAIVWSDPAVDRRGHRRAARHPSAATDRPAGRGAQPLTVSSRRPGCRCSSRRR